MKPFDYNEKYEFVSDGTWFEKGSKAKPEFLWLLPEYDTDVEIPYEVLLEKKDQIMGLFSGLRYDEIHNGMDEETCNLDEFDILCNIVYRYQASRYP